MSAPDPQFVDVTLRIDKRNLKSLLEDRHPAAYLWLDDNGDGTYTLCASVPLGDEARRRDSVNLRPEAKINHLSDDQRSELIRRWQKHPDAWGEAVKRAVGEVLAEVDPDEAKIHNEAFELP